MNEILRGKEKLISLRISLVNQFIIFFRMHVDSLELIMETLLKLQNYLSFVKLTTLFVNNPILMTWMNKLTKFPLLFIIQYNTPGKYSSNWETKWWQIWPTLPSLPPRHFSKRKVIAKSYSTPRAIFLSRIKPRSRSLYYCIAVGEIQRNGGDARIDFFVTHLIFEHRFRDKPRANSRWHTRAEDFKEWNTNMVPWRNPRDLWNQGENVTSLFNKGNFVDTPPRLIRTWAVSFRLKNDHRRLIARLGNFFFFYYTLITRPRYLWISPLFTRSFIKKKKCSVEKIRMNRINDEKYYTNRRV